MKHKKLTFQDLSPYSERVMVSHNKMVLHIRPDSSDKRKQDILAEWYREKLKEVVPALIAKWEPLMGVRWRSHFSKG